MGSIGRKLKAKSLVAQQKLGETTSQMEETLGGLRIIKAFLAEKKMSGRFLKCSNELRTATMRVTMRQAMAHPMSVKKNELGGRETCDHKTDGLDLVEETLTYAREVAEVVAELLKVHGRIVNGGSIELVLIVNRTQTEEALAVVDDLGLILTLLRAVLVVEDVSHIGGRETRLSDLHRHNALLLGGKSENVSVEIGDLFEKVLVTYESFSEADILSDNDDYQEEKSSPYCEGKNEAEDREDPVQYGELILKRIELLNIHREIKDLHDAEEKVRYYLPDSSEHYSHKSKKPIQKAFHCVPLLYVFFSFYMFTALLAEIIKILVENKC